VTARAKGILVAAALEAAFGDPQVLHPVAGFGRAAAALERRLWAPSRLRGAIYAAVLVAGAAVLGDRARGRALAEGTALFITLGGRSLVAAGLRLAELVEAGDLGAARRHAPTLMGREPGGLDDRELCRGGVESLAENTVDAVTGALWWHALLGPAGSCGYRAANTLDAMVGHRGPRYERFGWAAARLDDLVTWPAARVAAALAVVLGGRPGAAWAALRRYGREHPSPNAGLLEAAFAGTLGVRVGGTLRYGERVEHRPEIGVGPLPAPADVRRAAALSLRVSVASVALAVVLAERCGR
jgi:adenosylcobinamide-phosphate synthase